MTTVNSATSTTANTNNSSVQNQISVQGQGMDLFGNGIANDYFGSQCLWNNPYYQELNVEGEENGSSLPNMTKPSYVPTSSVEDLYLATQIANSIVKEYSGRMPAMYGRNGFFENDAFAQALTIPPQLMQSEQTEESETPEKEGIDYSA